MALLPSTAERDLKQSIPETLRVARDFLPRGYHAVARRAAFFKRRVVQSPAIRHWSDNRYQARRARHARNTPPVSDAQLAVLSELRDAGVAIRPAELPNSVVASADRFVRILRRMSTGDPCIKATPRQLAEDPALFTWGLSEHLLDLAECHIGLPVRYLGVEVKRELVGDADGGNHAVVRRWHLDHEDRRILKVIVYLSDVEAGSGPFGYVHRVHSDAILRAPHGRELAGVPDDAMMTVVPRSEWNRVTAPRMTAIHVDTGQVFHRVFPPSQSERYSVTFAYSSRNPYYAYSRLMLPRRALHLLRDQLSQRQWETLCVDRPRLRRGTAHHSPN